MSIWEKQAQKEVESLKEMYRQAVILSLNLGEAISERIPSLPESTSPDPKAYPSCQFQHFEVGGYPVYQFSYEGMLPLYIEDRTLQKELRDYYNRVTMEVFMKEIGLTQPESFDRAVVYMCHFFSNLRIRDLDNRNRSHLINAIRNTRIIKDDCWEKISTMESGFFDVLKNNHINVYVTHDNNMSNLINYVKFEVGKMG
ncbi:hypothetical protein ASL14_19125 [Paenibacillus sp. IHB B 3084]|uniref:hypothetical protein n=1 Tax=Paenibacillus sp. IHB B 3084 TaxID=867076 RepID=UPI00071F45BA|nr:hypothetical protein [Paenibacillus sp. IHB B 3084]ALP37985.1 hypothetical protein ASL14_19125 [Paenibacillus sp. IHB B 3084]